MKILNGILVAIVLIFINIYFANSQNKQKNLIQKPIIFELGANLEYSTASSFYNLNDSLVSSLIFNSNDTSRRYTFDFYHTCVIIQARYYLDEQFKIFINIPISFFELEEKYFRDKYGYRDGKQNYTLNRVDNVELGISKLWNIGSITTGFASSIRIPTGFHYGLYDDPNYSFLSDGALEFLLETEMDIKLKQYSFENDFILNFRGEEFKNCVIWNSGIGLHTVPNTKLKLFSEIHLSTEKFTNQTRPLVPNQEVSQENNYYAGAQLTLLFSRELYTKFGYKVSLYGKNSWKKGTAYFQVLYRI